MSEAWLGAIAAVVGGFLVGAALAWAARRLLQAPQRRAELHEIAAPVAAFLFWVAATAGIVLAIAAVEPKTIEDVPADVLSYLPRVLAAGLILLAGRALAVAMAAATGRAVARALGRPSTQAATVVRVAVILTAGVLALSQLGVDTTVLVVLATGVAVTFGLSFALLVGLGGRDAAREIAAGRYLRRFVGPGTRLRSAGLAGSVIAVHPLTVELQTDDGRRLHVPHSRLLGDVFEAGTPEGDADPDSGFSDPDGPAPTSPA